MPQFQTWLKQEHGKELPLPRVGTKMEIDKKVYSTGCLPAPLPINALQVLWKLGAVGEVMLAINRRRARDK